MNERLHFLFGSSSCLLWATLSPFPHTRLTAEPMFRVCLNTVVVDLQNVLRFAVSENHSRHLTEVLTPRLEPQVLYQRLCPIRKAKCFLEIPPTPRGVENISNIFQPILRFQCSNPWIRALKQRLLLKVTSLSFCSHIKVPPFSPNPFRCLTPYTAPLSLTHSLLPRG